jgi:hypothetical protein
LIATLRASLYPFLLIEQRLDKKISPNSLFNWIILPFSIPDFTVKGGEWSWLSRICTRFREEVGG